MIVQVKTSIPIEKIFTNIIEVYTNVKYFNFNATHETVDLLLNNGEYVTINDAVDVEILHY